MLERAAQKLRLDQLVIQQGRSSAPSKGRATRFAQDYVNLLMRMLGKDKPKTIWSI